MTGASQYRYRCCGTLSPWPIGPRGILHWLKHSPNAVLFASLAVSGEPITHQQLDQHLSSRHLSDSRAAHGNLRNRARLTAHTLTALNRTGRPRVDQEVLRWAFSLGSGT